MLRSIEAQHANRQAGLDAFTAVTLAEEGDLDNPEVLEAWQYLVTSGLAWTLQGWFGRTAAALIEAGEISQC